MFPSPQLLVPLLGGLSATAAWITGGGRPLGALVIPLAAGQRLRTSEVSTFLPNWLRHHIRKHDHAYIPALRGAGLIRPA